MEKAMHIGIIHYSCPPVVGGVEQVLSQQASILQRLGQSISVLSGMGEVYTNAFPVRLEPLLGSNHPAIMRAHEQLKEGNHKDIRALTNRICHILADWSRGVDVILAHNVLQMPFNLPLSLAIRRLATSVKGPAVVSWAHDSPFNQPTYPNYLNDHPWNVLRRPHPHIHFVTISQARRVFFEALVGDVRWRVISNGVDPATLLYLDQKSIKLAEELDLFNRDLVVVQPSRITPRKNLELSIHIVRGIKRLGYNILFVLTGAYDPHEGRAVSYYRRLRYWIKELEMQDNIAILAEYRFRDKERLVPDRIFIRDLYLMADLLLMTSKDEGFGLPLIEAGMLKLHIACSDIAPFLEVGGDVCLFGLDDPPLTIAGRIMAYLARSDTHRMFRNVMRKYVLEVVCRNELIPFLHELISKRREKE